MRRFVVLAVLLAACVAPPETGVDRTVKGPVATAAAVSIGYGPDTAPLGVGLEDLSSAWRIGAVEPFGVAGVRVVGGDAEALDPAGAVSLDVVVTDDEVVIAQLTIVNEAGDEDEAVAAELVLVYLEAVGASDVWAELGFGPDGGLYVETARSATSAVVVHRASNEDTVLLGAVGAP